MAYMHKAKRNNTKKKQNYNNTNTQAHNERKNDINMDKDIEPQNKGKQL